MLMAALAIASVGCGRPAVSPGHQFSLRLASHQPSEGMVAQTMRDTGETVYVSSQDIVIGTDFERIDVMIDSRGKNAMSFTVNIIAGERLSRATRNNVGGLIAMVVNGTPASSTPITSEFSSSFLISGDFSETELDQFYTAVTGYQRR